MGPVTPTRRSHASLKRSREPATPVRVGEVSSTASSPDSDDDVPPNTAARHVRGGVTAPATPTPRRKVVNAIDVPSPRTTNTAAKKRETLQSRLAAASTPITGTPRKSAATTTVSTPGPSNSDKVVVCMRIKPTKSEFLKSAYELTPTSLELAAQHPNVVRRGGKAGREAEYTYTFDALVQSPTQTPELYAANVAPLVQTAMNGFNSTVFAYGQTGSGKSHTMSGTPTELGIIPCAVDGIFDAITADCERAFLLRVSYIEIYNETLRDLLNFKKGPLSDDEKPAIHTRKGKVFVEPLVEEIVSTPQDVVTLLARGNTNRKTGATDWNERSSRSHAVFQIVIESRPRDSVGDDEIRVSRLTLIDLAGSEKAVSDVERRGEGKHINQSLLALREVINKLTEKGKKTHIPYRNSKLTHLLENVLGGDSNICVICTMSAEEVHSPETLETLKFAGRCSQVETKAQKHVLLSSDRAVIRAKDMEIIELKRQLEELGGGQRNSGNRSTEMAELADSVAAMEARKAKLSEQLAKLNGEILTSELPRSGFGLPIVSPRKKRPRISDFTSLSSAAMGTMGGMGIGLGTPVKSVDRRAVSHMVRVSEDDLAAAGARDAMVEKLDRINNGFDTEIAVTSLRRVIATKDEELAQQAQRLVNAIDDANELPGVKSELINIKADYAATRDEYNTKLRDVEAELESTRAEYLHALEDKGKQIDRLEGHVLEMRLAHDELVIEHKNKLDKFQQDLEMSEKERSSLSDKHKIEITKVKDAIRGLRAQANDHAARATALDTTRAELAAAIAKVETERDDLVSERDKLKATHANLMTERDALQTDANAKASHITTLRAERDAKAAQLDDFQRQSLQRESEVVTTLRNDVGSLRAERDAAQRDHDAAKADAKIKADQLDEFQRQALQRESEFNTVRTDLVQERESKAKAENKLAHERKVVEKYKDTFTKEKEIREKIKAEHNESRKKLSECQAANAKLEEAIKELNIKLEAMQEAAVKRETELKGSVNSLVSERDIHRDHAAQLKGQLASSQSQFKDKEQAHASSLREVEALRAGANVAESMKAELANARSMLDKERKERAGLVEAHTAAAARGDSLASQLDALKATADKDKDTRSDISTTLDKTKASLAAEQKAHADTAAKLKTAADHVAEYKRQIASEQQIRADHDKEAKKATEAHQAAVSALRKEVDEHKAARGASSSTTDKVRSDLDQARAELSQWKTAHAEADRKYDTEKHAREESERAAAAAREQLSEEMGMREGRGKEIEGIKQELAAASNSLAIANSDLAVAKTEIETLRKDLSGTREQLSGCHRELDAATKEIASLKADLANAKTAAAADTGTQLAMLQKELDLARTEHDAMRARSDRLAAELTNKDTSAQTSQEIEQLDKVVEAQRAMIEEQRAKIQFWSEQLEKQREVVRMLTEGDTAVAPTTPRGHSRTQSTSAVPSSPSTPGAYTRATRSGIPNTFTARNLALPSAPSPLPMHDGMMSTNALRKARRITIEHDIDRLQGQEKGRVSRIKGAFESPDRDAAPKRRM